jgi:response regulator RpfG family c-di-GMP phosphodiesterase
LPEVDDLRNFLWIFSQDSSGTPDEDGLPGHKLDVLRVTPWTQLVERLDKAVVDDTSDPRRHALVLYARALFLAQHDLAAHKAGKPTPRAKAVRVVQDLIEVFADHKETLLASWCAGTGSSDAALAAHLVNTTILAITFGKHLGLTRAQLKELGVAALSDELGLCKLPDELHWVTAPERLEPAAQAQCQAVANQTAATFLSEPGAGRLQHLLALSTLQMHLPYMHAVKDEQGHTILQPHDDRLYFSRLLAICAYFDALLIETGEHAALSPFEALTRMWKNERWRFDPQLLGVFVRVMAREPSFSRWHPASWSMQ